MELAELIAAVKTAATKDALETLVKDELSLDLDKRKTLRALRAEVLKGLGETAEDDADDNGETENGTPGDSSETTGSVGAPAAPPAPAPAAAPAVITPERVAAPAPSPSPAPAPVTPPDLDEAPEPESKPTVGNRLLKHKETGRTFVWTPALSTLAELEEV